MKFEAIGIDETDMSKYEDMKSQQVSYSSSNYPPKTIEVGISPSPSYTTSLKRLTILL